MPVFRENPLSWLKCFFAKNKVILLELSALIVVSFAIFTHYDPQATGGAKWLQGFLPITVILCAVFIVLHNLPEIKEVDSEKLKHRKNKAFVMRRGINWFIAGMVYAFLYWARYNLNPILTDIGGSELNTEFNRVFSAGTYVYAFSFLVNGPLTDRWGGRRSLLLGAIGASVANILMGFVIFFFLSGLLTRNEMFYSLVFLYPVNMYFQSFGAVAIVKCNAPWFHKQERGVFGGVFGILIALGLYFAFDVTKVIVRDVDMATHWGFFIPAIALLIAFVATYTLVRDRPSHAGFDDFDTEDGSLLVEGDKRDSPLLVIKTMLMHPVMLVVMGIEFCSGFLRQSVMQEYTKYTVSIGETTSFIFNNWGMLLCVAGIMGGMFAGIISDHFYQSRRGPVAVVLYIGMFIGSIGMTIFLGTPSLAIIAVFMSFCVIGVHGMLSAAAPTDFAGAKNVGIAVGMIDGCVYLGSGTMALLYSSVLPGGSTPAEIAYAAVADHWIWWPTSLIPVALIGLVLAYMIRHKVAKKAVAKS